MEEKRKTTRFIASLELEISSLFKQDNVKVENINAPITVVNVSKGGVGFQTASSLPLGYYFNACLQLSNDPSAKIFCVVKIIRAVDAGNGMTLYGCEFVGLAPVFTDIFEEFEKNSVPEP